MGTRHPTSPLGPVPRPLETLSAILPQVVNTLLGIQQLTPTQRNQRLTKLPCKTLPISLAGPPADSNHFVIDWSKLVFISLPTRVDHEVNTIRSGRWYKQTVMPEPLNGTANLLAEPIVERLQNFLRDAKVCKEFPIR